jgi:hypothetical protein
MTLSAQSIQRKIQLLIVTFVVVGLMVPAVASAGEFEHDTAGEDVEAIVAGETDAALVSAEVVSCVLSDPSKGDHHEKKSWAEKAQEWEDGAEKHIEAGNHKQAGGAYMQAGCNWERAGELEKAAEAYEKAAEQYKKAGEDDLASTARKKARELRKSMR